MLPELHAEAWTEMFEPGVKISPAVGLTTETLGARTFVDEEPGTTVHGAGEPPVVPVPVGLAEGEVLVPVGEPLAVAVVLEDAVGEDEAVDEAPAVGDELGLELEVAPVLQATPLRVNAVGVSMAPLRLKFAPMPVDAPVAREPFQLRLATETVLALCVQVPSQPLARVSEPAYAYCRFQEVSAGPSLVMVIWTSKPEPQFEVTLYATAQAGVVAAGAAAPAAADSGAAGSGAAAAAPPPAAMVPATSALQPAHRAARRHRVRGRGPERNVRMDLCPP
jgi:hypothetical protein